eukprot:9277654-Pyramimonas_sp.AAC.1
MSGWAGYISWSTKCNVGLSQDEETARAKLDASSYAKHMGHVMGAPELTRALNYKPAFEEAGKLDGVLVRTHPPGRRRDTSSY